MTDDWRILPIIAAAIVLIYLMIYYAWLL